MQGGRGGDEEEGEVGDMSTAQRLCCQPHPGPPDVPVIPLSVCVNGTRSGYAPSHSYLLQQDSRTAQQCLFSLG